MPEDTAPQDPFDLAAPSGGDATDSFSDDSPAPADAPSSTSPNSPGADATEDDDDAQLDATIDALRSGKDRDAARQAYAGKPQANKQQTPATTEPTTPAGEREPAGTTPAAAAPAQPATPLPPDAPDLLSRFHVKPAAFAKMDPADQAEFIDNLRTRHNDGMRMFGELQALKQQGGQPAPQPQQPATPAKPAQAPAAAADPLALLDKTWREYFGDDQPIAPALKAAIEGMVNPLQDQLTQARQLAEQGQQFMQQAIRDQEAADKSDGVKAVKELAAKANVNLDLRTAEGKANHESLLGVAHRFLVAEQMRLGPNWNRQAYNYAHAISDAFATTFKPQNLLAQRRQAADAAVQAAKRGGDSRGLPARGQPARSEDDVLDDVYDATKSGGREAGLRVAAGRS